MVTVRNADGYVVRQWTDLETIKGVTNFDLENKQSGILGVYSFSICKMVQFQSSIVVD